MLSSAPSKQPAEHRPETRNLVRNAPTQKEAMTIVVEAEARRKPERPIRWQIPGNDRGQIVRSFMKAKVVAIAEATVHFDARAEVLSAKRATLRGGFERERPARA